MTPLLRVACTAALALLFPACEEERQPLGPTALDEGIVVYIHAGFRGSSQAIAADVPDLDKVEGPCSKGDGDSTTLSWDDCISSIRVMSGWGVTTYRDRDFKGTAVELTADSVDLSAVNGSCDGSFNDCISSLRVYRR
jgi:Beta/Gamma crystallin